MVFLLGAALEALQRAPRRAKRPPRGPKMVHEGSEMPQDRSKTPKMAPRHPKRPPRALPRGPQEVKFIVFLKVLDRFGRFHLFGFPTPQDGPQWPSGR